MTDSSQTSPSTDSTPPERASLTPADLLVEARADALPALIGLAAALVTAILITAVGLAALSLAGSSDDLTGGEVDTGSLLNVLLFPIQVLGMGLLGTLSLSFDEASGHAYAPFYWVTAAYVVATAWAARRRTAGRDRVPFVSLVRSGALAGTAMALVLVVLLRLLALRDGGATIHTSSVSLFVGVLLLTLAGVAVGGWSTMPRWHRGIDLDVVVAGRLMWSVFVAWLVVVVPIAAVLALFGEGVGGLLAVLIVAPTLAVGAIELSHLGAYSAAGDLAFAWSDGALIGIALPLAGLVSLLLTSVAWHLRRTRPATGDVRSWAVLPALGLVAGLVLLIAGLLVIGGGFGGFSGGVTVAPAWWTVLLFGIWGFAVEALSRSVAPALAPVVPGVLRVRLERRRPLHAGEDSSEAHATAPERRTPEQRRRDRRILLAAGGVLGSLVLLGVAYSIVGSVFFGPEREAEAYLDAVVDGDLAQAQELAPFDLEADEALYVSRKIAFDGARSDLFSSEVYAGADERITGYEITDTESRGDARLLTVELEGVSGASESEIVLVEDGRRWGIFPDWSVAEGGLAQTVFAPVEEETDALTVNGVDVEVEPGADQWMLPGSYVVDPFADNPFIEMSESEPLVVTTEGTDLALPAQPQPTEEFRDELQSRVDAYLDDCMSRTELAPQGCPQSGFAFGDSPRKIQWEVTQAPTVDLEYIGTEFPTTVYITEGEATVTYEADESFGFGPADFRRSTDEAYLSFTAEVDVQGDELVVEFDS